jgi:hypothetical protein
MSCCLRGRRGVLAGLLAVCLGFLAGCTPPSSTPGPASRPAAAETGKPAKDNGTTSGVTQPAHIPADK